MTISQVVCVAIQDARIGYTLEQWTDFIIEGKAKAITDGFSLNLLGRWQDENNYYGIELYRDHAYIVKRINGSYNYLNVMPFPTESNKWYTLKGEFDGTVIKMYVNDSLLMTAEDATFLEEQLVFVVVIIHKHIMMTFVFGLSRSNLLQPFLIVLMWYCNDVAVFIQQGNI